MTFNLKHVLLTVVIFGFSLVGMAQKMGHIDSNELLKLMPGRADAEASLKKHTTELEAQYKLMNSELETKYQEYTASQATMTELIKQMKVKELEDLQQRIQAFQQSAQAELEKKEQELLAPIIDAAKKAIQDVAAENGFTYVFDSGVGSLLVAKGEDLLPKVKKKLNLQ